jgi:UDP-N-acetylglucosamine 2-epimerase (non-hydrolysing)
MPEEINRILTDSISDFLFVTEQDGLVNLAREGVAPEKIHFVGNVMIDSLVYFREKAKEIRLADILKEAAVNTVEGDIQSNNFALMTMHRPSNVDHRQGLEDILQIIRNTAHHLPVLFPMHPRTRNNLEKLDLLEVLHTIQNIVILEPQGYLQFLHLMDHARIVITDSGGIQEETTFLQVPCLTFRSSTERPITTLLGTNQLLKDLNPDTVYEKTKAILEGRVKAGVIPPLWDGHTAERIRDILVNKLS